MLVALGASQVNAPLERHESLLMDGSPMRYVTRARVPHYHVPHLGRQSCLFVDALV